jgi:hypothetical protein
VSAPREPVVRAPDDSGEAEAGDGAAHAPSRRGFLGGLATAIAAVAVVRVVEREAAPEVPAPSRPRWIGHY